MALVVDLSHTEEEHDGRSGMGAYFFTRNRPRAFSCIQQFTGEIRVAYVSRTTRECLARVMPSSCRIDELAKEALAYVAGDRLADLKLVGARFVNEFGRRFHNRYPGLRESFDFPEAAVDFLWKMGTELKRCLMSAFCTCPVHGSSVLQGSDASGVRQTTGGLSSRAEPSAGGDCTHDGSRRVRGVSDAGAAADDDVLPFFATVADALDGGGGDLAAGNEDDHESGGDEEIMDGRDPLARMCLCDSRVVLIRMIDKTFMYFVEGWLCEEYTKALNRERMTRIFENYLPGQLRASPLMVADDKQLGRGHRWSRLASFVNAVHDLIVCNEAFCKATFAGTKLMISQYRKYLRRVPASVVRCAIGLPHSTLLFTIAKGQRFIHATLPATLVHREIWRQIRPGGLCNLIGVRKGTDLFRTHRILFEQSGQLAFMSRVLKVCADMEEYKKHRKQLRRVERAENVAKRRAERDRAKRGREQARGGGCKRRRASDSAREDEASSDDEDASARDDEPQS